MKQKRQPNKEYVAANRAWLAEKAKEPGVMKLEGGVLCKIVDSGEPDAKSPSPNDIVSVYYEGWTIDGKKFDSCLLGAPAAFRLRDLVEGWIVALQHMRVGDRWEIYVPAEMGYGDYSQPGIPGGSTLIFKLTLVGVS